MKWKLIILTFSLIFLLTGVVSAAATYTAFAAYGDAWKSYNDTYTVIKWNTTGARTPWNATGNATTVEYVVVGAGGGGGKALGGGGGGAGGYWEGTISSLSGEQSVTVGDGGAASSTNNTVGTIGGNSTFSSITGIGGSGGGSAYTSTVVMGGSAGGAGSKYNGGAGAYQYSNTSSQTGHGNRGGFSIWNTTTAYTGGGGGGYASYGVNASPTTKGGNGGAAAYTNITGTLLTLAGGGGGGTYSSTSSQRGGGGANATTGTTVGGAGGYRTNNAGTATASTGSGGGGGGSTGTGSSGSGGVVIIRYANPPAPVASFTSNVTLGAAPLSVAFTDTSATSITGWNWAYKNETSTWTQFSTSQNPSYSFPFGLYNINLTVTNSSGSTSIIQYNYTSSGRTQIIENNDAIVSETTPDLIWALMRNAGGDTVSNNPADTIGASIIAHASSSGIWSQFDRGLTTFNISLLNGKTIDSAKLYFEHSYSENSYSPAQLCLIDAYPASPTTFAAGDYDGTTYTKQGACLDFSYSASFFWTSITLTNFTGLNTGTYKTYMWDMNQSVYNASPTWSAGGANDYWLHGVSYGGGTSKQFLMINFSAGAGAAPVASFSSNITAGAQTPRPVAFTDTSTNAPTAWNWSLCNVTGNNTEMWFSTSQNPIKIFTAGNWSIKLNASNSYGSDITAGTYFVNVSQEIPITPQEYPKVVLMFDDGYTSTITNAYPILAAYNYNATAYVVTDWITSGVAGNMSVSNLTTLYNSGWDIGNHGSQHFDMQVCTTAQDQALIQQGQTNITNWGFTRAAYHLAYPYGAYDSDAMTAAANVGTLTARTVNSANITFPVASLYDLPITIECDDTVPVIEVTNAIANNNLVNRSVFILFHYVDNTAGTYHWTPEHLTELIEYIHTNGYQPITISQWYTLNSGGATTPVASFTINKNSVRIPNSITATDTSTNTPTSWQWSWGDGTVNSTTQNPTHTYTKRGKFTINMAATNTGGTDAADASSVRVVGYENYY